MSLLFQPFSLRSLANDHLAIWPILPTLGNISHTSAIMLRVLISRIRKIKKKGMNKIKLHSIYWTGLYWTGQIIVLSYV